MVGAEVDSGDAVAPPPWYDRERVLYGSSVRHPADVCGRANGKKRGKMDEGWPGDTCPRGGHADSSALLGGSGFPQKQAVNVLCTPLNASFGRLLPLLEQVCDCPAAPGPFLPFTTPPAPAQPLQTDATCHAALHYTHLARVTPSHLTP